MAAEYDIVDVFVGTFPSKAALNQYLKETYTEDDKGAPISAFARDLGQTFYDHDFLESTFRKAAKDFSKLCSGLSFSDYWLPGAAAAYKSAGMTGANTVLLAFGEVIDEPQSVAGVRYTLHYLGRFEGSASARTEGAGPNGLPAVCYLQIPYATALVNGQPLKLIPIDAAGAVIGQAGSADGSLYIDLPVTDKPIAPQQVRIYPDQFGQWIIEDVAGGDVTAYRGEALNCAKVMPGHEQGFGIGGVFLSWLAWKR